MARKNNKKHVLSHENAIRKSNELSMSKLNQGLTLNEMQLLAFAIYSTQKNGITSFNKAEFEKKFDLEKYQTVHAKKDAQSILNLKFSIEDLENDYFEFYNVFQSIKYDKGLFSFKWTDDIIPHILELKEKYVSTDLTVTSKFKSGFSWVLYEYLKAHYGYWHKPISKEALLRLFGVDDRPTYVKSTAQFKRGVLDVAVSEINKYTELEVWYLEEKKGRAIVGFDIHWSTGEITNSATLKQIKELRTILNAVYEDMFSYVNLKDDDDRQSAIELIRKCEEMRTYTDEPICITKERASLLIQNANSYLSRLEYMADVNRRGKMKFYDWLKERDS